MVKSIVLYCMIVNRFNKIIGFMIPIKTKDICLENQSRNLHIQSKIQGIPDLCS